MEFDLSSARFYAYVEQETGSTPAQIQQKLAHVFGDAAPAYSTVAKWCSQFRQGRTTCRDLPRPGRPRTSVTERNVERVSVAVQANPRTTASVLSAQFDISKGSVLQILHEKLGMRKLCSVWVPHELTNENKELRVRSARGILDVLAELGTETPSLYAVEDESWFAFHPKLPKQENKSWVGPDNKRMTVVKQGLTKKKTLLLICFTTNRKVWIETVPYGETVNSSRYIDFLTAVGDHWRRLCRDPRKLRDIFLQHDNARPHTSAESRNFLQRRSVRQVYQSPYSPDFNLCDRWMFSALKCQMKNMTFETHVRRSEDRRDASFCDHTK